MPPGTSRRIRRSLRSGLLARHLVVAGGEQTKPGDHGCDHGSPVRDGQRIVVEGRRQSAADSDEDGADSGNGGAPRRDELSHASAPCCFAPARPTEG